MVVVTGNESYWILIAASVVQGGVISISCAGPAVLHFRASSDARVRHQRHLPVDVDRAAGPSRQVRPRRASLIGVAFFGLAGVFFSAGVLGALSVVLLAGLPRGAPSKPIRAAALWATSPTACDSCAPVRTLVHLLAVSFGVVLVGFPYMAFLPVVAEKVHHSGSTGFGLLNAAAAVGAA